MSETYWLSYGGGVNSTARKCRRTGRPATIKPIIESQCRWCLRTIESVRPRKFHDECFKAKTRVRVRVYHAMKLAAQMERGEEA